MASPLTTLRLFLRRWLAALQAFTRIPVRGSLAEWADLQPEVTQASAAHYPGAGLVIGMAACMAFALVSLPLPQGPFAPLVAAVGCTMASVLLTGGREEDSLRRHGGVLALVLLLAGKLALLALLGFHTAAGVLAALLAGHAVSRFWPLLLARSLAGPEAPGTTVPLVRPVDGAGLAVAAGWCAIPLVLMVLAGRLPFLLLALGASGVAFVALRRRFRGAAAAGPDALAFTQQVCETAFYLGAAFGIPR